MSTDEPSKVVSGWAYSSMRPEVANAAAATVSAPLSEVPRLHGTVVLTRVAHALLGYWWHVRGDKIIPNADDIALHQLRRLAPYVRYMHWDGPALIHRLWGSALTEGIGVDMTGHDVMAYIPEDLRPANYALFNALHDHPCGVVLVTRDKSPLGSGRVGEMTFLPVNGPDGAGPRLIGTMQWREPDGIVDPLDVRAGTPQSLTLEDVSFIDLGAGTPDPDLLRNL